MRHPPQEAAALAAVAALQAQEEARERMRQREAEEREKNRVRRPATLLPPLNFETNFCFSLRF